MKLIIGNKYRINNPESSIHDKIVTLVDFNDYDDKCKIHIDGDFKIGPRNSLISCMKVGDMITHKIHPFHEFEIVDINYLTDTYAVRRLDDPTAPLLMY